MTRFGFESDLRIILTVRKLFEFNRAHINKLVNRSKLVGCYLKCCGVVKSCHAHKKG